MVELSIITLTHGNRGGNLQRCIESVLKNTPSPIDFEYFVIDNNASKETHGVISTYTRLPSPPFYWIHLKDNEGTPARNHAIEMAEGKYFAIIDDDVIVTDPRWFPAMKSILDAPDAWAAGECGAFYNPNGEAGFFGGGAGPGVKYVDYLTGYHVLYKNLRNPDGTAKYLIDPKYKSLREESDLGFQAKMDGYRLIQSPSFCQHHSIRQWDSKFDSIDGDTKYFIEKWTPKIQSGELKFEGSKNL